ncbi:MAG: hypothetical protein KAT77_05545 [Nanoarchaeota archaeon]|nr:hypothetical protein [Nanoarchaeota archaeon]
MEEKNEHKETHHETKHHKTKKKTNFWPYISLVLVIILAVSLYFNVSSPKGGITGLSTADAGNKMLTFVNENLMQPGTTAELNDIQEMNGIYQIKLSVLGQEFTSYLTKDGEIFFPQGYVLEELEEQIANSPTAAAAAPPTTEVPKSDTPTVKMFVMTYCPYGQQAEAGLGPALELLGDIVEFEPHFVIYNNYATNRGGAWEDYCFDEEEQYCSMHGINELNEGVRQLCIYDSTPEKWWKYVNKINADCALSDIETCWKDAAKYAGIDVEEVETCFENKGELLLKKELLLNQQFGVQGSPSIFINDASYSGGRAPENYKAGICDAFNEAPEECDEELNAAGGAAEGSC